MRKCKIFINGQLTKWKKIFYRGLKTRGSNDRKTKPEKAEAQKNRSLKNSRPNKTKTQQGT